MCVRIGVGWVVDVPAAATGRSAERCTMHSRVRGWKRQLRSDGRTADVATLEAGDAVDGSPDRRCEAFGTETSAQGPDVRDRPSPAPSSQRSPTRSLTGRRSRRAARVRRRPLSRHSASTAGRSRNPAGEDFRACEGFTSSEPEAPQAPPPARGRHAPACAVPDAVGQASSPEPRLPPAEPGLVLISVTVMPRAGSCRCARELDADLTCRTLHLHRTPVP